MKKDFKKWHALKSEIDTHQRTLLYHEQEIWWCSLGANVGVETDGKSDLFERPVIIFRRFNEDMFWGLPMTSQSKIKKPFYSAITFHDHEQIVILSQIRVLSSKRLIRRLGKLSDNQFAILEKSFEEFLKQTDPSRGPRVPNGNK